MGEGNKSIHDGKKGGRWNKKNNKNCFVKKYGEDGFCIIPFSCRQHGTDICTRSSRIHTEYRKTHAHKSHLLKRYRVKIIDRLYTGYVLCGLHVTWWPKPQDTRLDCPRGDSGLTEQHNPLYRRPQSASTLPDTPSSRMFRLDPVVGLT